MVNVNAFIEYPNEMLKFFQDITKVKEEFLTNTIKNNLHYTEKTKISYKVYNKEEKQPSKDDENILNINKKSISDNILSSTQTKNRVRTKSDYINVDWKDKLNILGTKGLVGQDSRNSLMTFDIPSFKTFTSFMKNEGTTRKFSSIDYDNRPIIIEEMSRNNKSNSPNKFKTSLRESIDKSIGYSQKSERRRMKSIASSVNLKTSKIFNLNSERIQRNDNSEKNVHLIFWKNTLNSEEFIYNSGKFNLPLISQKLKIMN